MSLRQSFTTIAAFGCMHACTSSRKLLYFNSIKETTFYTTQKTGDTTIDSKIILSKLVANLSSGSAGNIHPGRELNKRRNSTGTGLWRGDNWLNTDRCTHLPVRVSGKYLLTTAQPCMWQVLRHEFTLRPPAREPNTGIFTNPIHNPAIVFNEVKQLSLMTASHGYGHSYDYVCGRRSAKNGF